MATNTWPMSALGHKWTYAVQKAMSALPSIADIRGYDRNVRFCANSGHHSTHSIVGPADQRLWDIQPERR